MSEAIALAAAPPWRARSPWEGHARAGRAGRNTGAAGVTLSTRDGYGLATVIAAGDTITPLEGALGERLGLGLPEPGRALFSGPHGLVWSGPGQWLAVSRERGSLKGLAHDLSGLAAVTDQSDSRGIVAISGPQARAMLSKGVAVDLHPCAFAAGSAALTSLAHVAVQLWQRDEAPSYELAVPRSFTGSVWSWLTGAAAEYGYEVVAA